MPYHMVVRDAHQSRVAADGHFDVPAQSPAAPRVSQTDAAARSRRIRVKR